MISGVVWMLNWRSRGSSGTGLVSQRSSPRDWPPPPDENHRRSRRADPAAVRRRRPALPEAAGPSHPPRAGRGAGGAAGGRADSTRRVRVPAGGERRAVRLDGVQPLPRGTAHGGTRPVLRDRRAAGHRSGRVRPTPVTGADDASAPAGPRGPARAAVPRAQDPRARALSLLSAWTSTTSARGSPWPITTRRLG